MRHPPFNITLSSISEKAEHENNVQVSGGERHFTSQRSSKRLHLREKEFPTAAVASNRISQATNWVGRELFLFFLTILKVVAKESAASDPYSIINYGLGGQIEVNIVCIALDLNVLTIPGTR